MFIWWRGKGLAVPIVTFLALGLAHEVGAALFGPAALHKPWLTEAGLILAALILWPLGRRLNGQSPRVLVDHQTGQRVVMRTDHSLYSVKVEYWALFLGLGAVGTILSYVRPA